MIVRKTVYQAFKFLTTDPALAELIRTQPNARAARSEAGFQHAHQRPDWFEVNVEAMDVVLQAKFTQHEDLREKLLGTGKRELIEDSPVRCSVLSRRDAWWTEKKQIGRCVLGNRKGWSGA
jgi:predicted NAD-dependent protein-ADP-ribosyltransferase YbiA (DUF1768 family)